MLDPFSGSGTTGKAALLPAEMLAEKRRGVSLHTNAWWRGWSPGPRSERWRRWRVEALRTKFSHVDKVSSCVFNTLSLILNNRTFTSTASTSTTLKCCILQQRCFMLWSGYGSRPSEYGEAVALRIQSARGAPRSRHRRATVDRRS